MFSSIKSSRILTIDTRFRSSVTKRSNMGMYDPWGAENVNDLQPYEVFATHSVDPWEIN